jgi:hypothetical protein
MSLLPPRIARLLLATLMLAAPAAAQVEDCHCDCYFFFDCSPGTDCDFGTSFTIEENCWWRKPKPMGVIGAGCTDDHGIWGQCDGLCVPIGAAALAPGERREDVTLGMRLWSDALDDASLSGGGPPAAEWIAMVESIEFAHPTVPYRLWRVAIEVAILSRGAAYVVFPQEAFTAADVAVADLRRRPDLERNGDVAFAVLLAEIEQPGSGRAIASRIDERALDRDLLSGICGGAAQRDGRVGSRDLRRCLYERLAALAAALRRPGDEADGGAAAGEVQPQCPGCPGDVVPSDAVDFQDLIALLAAWETAAPEADLDGNGIVGFGDLLQLLLAWGNCA